MSERGKDLMKKILIVDDSIINLKLAEKALKEDYQTIMVSSGQAAIEYLEANTVDMILLDIMMPDMDGFETLTAIRKNADIKQDIPVVFLTADNEQSSIMKAASFGIHDFIVKPFIPKDLLARINKYFNL